MHKDPQEAPGLSNGYMSGRLALELLDYSTSHLPLELRAKPIEQFSEDKHADSQSQTYRPQLTIGDSTQRGGASPHSVPIDAG